MRLIKFQHRETDEDIIDVFINPVHIVSVYQVISYSGCRIEVVNRKEPFLIAEEINDVLTKLHDC